MRCIRYCYSAASAVSVPAAFRHHESVQLPDPRARCGRAEQKKRFAGTSLCTGTSASHFLTRADEEGTVHVEIGSKDAELKLDKWTPHVSDQCDLDILLSRRTQGAPPWLLS